MTSSGSLFLDTTIQIERVVGSRARQAELRQLLAGRRLATSTYVLGEYLRTLVRDATLLHRLVLDHEHLDDVMTAIARHRNKRESGRMLLLWANVQRAGVFGRHHILDMLESYVNGSLVSCFLSGIDDLLDTTGCGLARERPVAVRYRSRGVWHEGYELRAQCTRRHRECALAERLVEWQPQVRRLADGLRDHAEPALARMGRLAADLGHTPDLARGRNCTWYLGDLIVALEAPPGTSIFTTNRRHFAPLCALLGKPLFVEEGMTE